MTLKQTQEVEKNFNYFQSILPTLMESDRGRYALLQGAKIVAVYDTIRDAHITGKKFCGSRPFSIQKVETRPIYIGV